MFQKIIIILSSLFFVYASAFAQTQTSTTGRFTYLNKGDQAPFSGTLFDVVATAKLIASKQRAQEECELKNKFEKELAHAQCNRDTDLLKVELEIEKKKYNLIVSAQHEEITALRKLAKGGDNTLWATIGFALGAITSVAIFFAAVEIAK